MAVLHGILKDSWAHYRNLESLIRKRLEDLPKGSIFRRAIGNQKYYYLSVRKNNRSWSHYLGKQRRKDLEKAIQERQLLMKQLKEVRQNLRLLAKTRPRVRRG